MSDRLTRWEGCLEDGTPKAVLINRDGPFWVSFHEAMRKLAILEDEAEAPKIQTNIFDKEEIYPDCTVQVLTNTITGEVSVGWWENE